MQYVPIQTMKFEPTICYIKTQIAVLVHRNERNKTAGGKIYIHGRFYLFIQMHFFVWTNSVELQKTKKNKKKTTILKVAKYDGSERRHSRSPINHNWKLTGMLQSLLVSGKQEGGFSAVSIMKQENVLHVDGVLIVFNS